MGKCTYESGYKFGLEPGKAAYPHMDHYIFSKTISFDHQDEKIMLLPNLTFQKLMRSKNNLIRIFICVVEVF